MLVRTKEVMFSTCFMDTVRWKSSIAWLPLMPNCRLNAAAYGSKVSWTDAPAALSFFFSLAGSWPKLAKSAGDGLVRSPQ